MGLESLSAKLLSDGIISRPLVANRSVGGGCINACYQVQSGPYLFFLKMNSASAYPGMFEKEAAGLQLLRESGTLGVPKVIGHYDLDDTAFLLMDYIAPGRQMETYWSDCGHSLAVMHRNSRDGFGLDHDNYIGSLVQLNDTRSGWAEFYLDCRMIPQLEIGVSAGWAVTKQFREAEGVARVIDEEFPEEPAALLHGDLWSGNLMTGPKGGAVLVDPAVYYGNREVEITFTQLFGGFRPEFYEAYNNEWPLQPDFRNRMPVHNLYPLMVHANLFGGHYVQEVLRILKQYG
jgi:fructosamine-3-kinase